MKSTEGVSWLLIKAIREAMNGSGALPAGGVHRSKAVRASDT
jgi:hypothetical protein